MNKTFSQIFKNFQRCFFVLVVMVFVLLTSCPVKNYINKLVNTLPDAEQNVTNDNDKSTGNTSKPCANAKTANTEIPKTISFSTNDFPPALVLITTILFVPSYKFDKVEDHLLYENLSIPQTIPIFLKYRKVII